MKNKYFTLFAMICSLLLFFASDTTTFAKCSLNNVYTIESTTSDIEPTASKIVWKYKSVNGVVYRRLYNATTKEWIGDWIQV